MVARRDEHVGALREDGCGAKTQAADKHATGNWRAGVSSRQLGFAGGSAPTCM